ncbi:alpha/beta hydrolase [Streptomyces agglomeratus]|uniref:alpha/beta hydrolase n=1 Tax=Streptomyces agglomeratus TaxID=285458 RepID=UPI000A7866DC|nr:alpha/beta hydrolase fold domain-containing protein [Streptomyces agglomeratus]
MTAAPDRLDPDARALADVMAAAFPDLGGSVTDAVLARRLIDAIPRPAVEPPPVGSVEDRTVPGPPGAPDVPVRIYRPGPPAGQGPRPTVVYYHGGGWVVGGLDSHDTSLRELCRASGAVLVSVDYRLAPEAPFPAAVEDAYAALVWAADRAGELGGDPRSLVVAGDSAGGTLAAVVALAAKERGGPAPALQVLVYPATDAGQDTGSYRANATGYFMEAAALRWFWEQYLGPDGDEAHPYASPLRAADLSGLPPAHLVTAGCDSLCDEGRAYAERLRAAGVPVSERHYPGMFHGFFAFPGLLADARDALSGVAEAVARTAGDRKNRCDHRGSAG